MHVSNERLDRSFRVEGPKRATRPRMRRRAGPEVPGPMYDPRHDPNHPHTAPSGRWGPTPGAAAPPPGPALGARVAQRWASWRVAQAPLGLPLGVVVAGLARHHVIHVPAHELSPSAQRRRRSEDTARQVAARRRAVAAPLTHKGRGVLGAWAGGDLHTWRTGPWCVVPDGTLALGPVVVGLPGARKTETL